MTLIFKAFLEVKVKFYDTKLFLHISHYFAFCSVAHFSVLDLSKINSKFCVSTWTLRKSFQHHTQCMTIFNSALYLLTFQTTFMFQCLLSIYLYSYKIVAFLFLCNATPPTVLVIEGWNFDTNPPIVGGRHLTNFFGIGPRVPRLGPNLGQNLNKIAITR